MIFMTELFIITETSSSCTSSNLAESVVFNNTSKIVLLNLEHCCYIVDTYSNAKSCDQF